jgi:catechol 2,3-dioxygenase-like lactoylglutathione lyase family enzyme
VVSDTDKSLAFYRDLLGLRVVGESENHGIEQEHLNQVFGARLHITALRAERGPGIEFLEYVSPPGGRPLPNDAKSNDLVFWHTDLLAEGFNDLASGLRERETRFVSTLLPGLSSKSLNTIVVRDPDGHALKLLSHTEPSLSTIVNPSERPINP